MQKLLCAIAFFLFSAAFGKVIQGMNVVRKIHNAPSDGPVDDPYIKGQIIEKPVVILGMERIN